MISNQGTTGGVPPHLLRALLQAKACFAPPNIERERERERETDREREKEREGI